VNGSNLR